jgi:radical SAM protein (TIGR01212 family)
MSLRQWGEKPYYSLDYYLKQTYGKKLYKLSLNAGLTCPNRDGTLGTRGCIFCSEGGSGDFSSSSALSITEQIEEAKKKVDPKLKPSKDITGFIPSTSNYIAYFQAFTNTYGDLTYLNKIYTEAINHPDIAILSIATRPDCLNEDILNLLAALNERKPVWIELGLQSCHEKTAKFIRRGYSLPVFEEAVYNLRKRHLTTIVHLILGLPGENASDIIESVSYVASLPIQGVKLQLLHILKNTDLAKYNPSVFTMEEYADLIIRCIENLPKDIVIHRITGDGPKNLLVAPLWSSNKKAVLNLIHKEFKNRKTWQGKKLETTNKSNL